MKKEWFFDCYCGQRFAALMEDGELVEFTAEKKQNAVLVGNVYKGKVTNVLSGMNAAFINCGLAKNCYLSTDETYADYTKYDGTFEDDGAPLANLKEGDEVLVQITKPPRGTKGAKVSTRLSFVGKRLIYLPNTDFMGISRKITDEALREKLLQDAEEMRAPDKSDGYILRTQAPFATKEQLEKEAAYLKKLYSDMLEAAKNAAVGDLVYSDDDLPVRTMRDSFGDEISVMHVGNRESYERLLKLVRLREDLPMDKLQLYTGNRSMFREYGISDLLTQVTQPTVPLKSGGYLVIEQTEALTVIDVNSGGFIGEKRLEDTVFQVNLEAAIEIAKQVRLRNIGGIVVVDFIDMTEEEHKLAVNAKLAERLSLDRAKCNVLPMSELCLTQFTRKRLGNELSEYLVRPCPYCEGNGSVAADISLFTALRDDLLDCFANGFNTVIAHINEKVAKRIFEDGVFAEEMQGVWKNKRVYLVPHKTYREDYFTVKGDASALPTVPENAQLLS
ncbi:MAG: Rne/Rng family ribonuclease [Clostridia bacterium]|nr:Rne/Rng family ribonuclease [Clostridia bacterium]